MKNLFLRLIVLAGAINLLPVAAQTLPSAGSFEPVPNVRNTPYSFAFTRDGARAVTGGGDGLVNLWDVRSGRLLRTLSGHTDQVQSVVFSADGLRIVSASKDKSVKLWDASTGQLMRSVTLQLPAERIAAIALSPDGSRVASGTFERGMKLWDSASGRLISTFPKEGGIGGTYAVAFSSDGSRIVSGSSDPNGQVKLWDAGTGRLIRSFNGHQRFSSVETVAISLDSTKILSGGAAPDNTMRLWDAATGKLLRTFTHPDGVYSVAFSPDGSRVSSGSADHNLRLWSLTTGQLQSTLAFYWTPYSAFSPDSRLVLSGSPSYPVEIKLANSETGQVLSSFGGNRDYLVGTTFSSDGSRILAGGTSFRQLDAKTGQILSSLPAESKGAFADAFSRDGNRVVWRMADTKTLKVADTLTGKILSVFSGHSESVSAVALSPDSTRVLSGGGFNEKTIKLWDALNGRLLRTFAQESVESLAFSPDGRFAASANFDKTVKIWDVATGQLVRTFVHKGSAWSVAFSPDGSRLLSGDTKNNVYVWDVASGRQLRILLGHTAPIYHGVSFSPDGTQALSASDDKTVKLWDLATGNLVRSINVDARSPAFSSDGKRALMDNAVWDLNTGQRLVSIIASDGDEWLAITAEGFFAASKKGADILSVVKGFEVYAIDQFFQSLYRPDLVREKLAGDARGLVREAAANLDLNKVIESGRAPDVRLTLPGRSLGTGNIDAGSVSAEAEVVEQGGGIGRVEWRVNGVTAAIDTPAGISAGQTVRLSRSFVIDPGDNLIEVVAYNGANLIASVPARSSVAAQALASPVQPQSSPSKPPEVLPVAETNPRLFVLVAGINEYADKRIRLSYAVSDAKDVARGFKEAGGGLYRSVEVKLMTDGEVTRDKLDAAFREMTARGSSADVFVLYLAGHGKTVDGRYYFIPQDFSIDGEFNEKAINAAVKTKAIAQDQWQRWFAAIPARKSVILFDTCDSGTLTGDDGETQQLEKGAANDRLAQATGRSILTASGGSQEALEGYRGHGLFTYVMLDGLNRADGDRNGTIEVTELAAFVYAQVTEVSEKVFKQRQAPQMKITANYPLAKQTVVLQDETTPVAESKPAYQLAQTAQLQVQPGPGSTVVRSLSAKTAVTVLESKSGWALIASGGKPIGYIATRDLVPIQ